MNKPHDYSHFFYYSSLLHFSLSPPLRPIKWSSVGAPVTRLPVSLPHLFLKWHFQQLVTPGTSPPSIHSVCLISAVFSGIPAREKPLKPAQIFRSSSLELLNYCASLSPQSVIFYCLLPSCHSSEWCPLLAGCFLCSQLQHILWSNHSNHIQVVKTALTASHLYCHWCSCILDGMRRTIFISQPLR